MSKEQMIVSIVVAIIGAIAASLGGGFAFAQFLIKRRDEKEEKDVQKIIDAAIQQAKKEMRQEFNEGLVMRGEEGKERFDTHQESIKEINKRIESNSEQIGQILGIVKDQAEKYEMLAESLASLNMVSKANAEAMRSTNYDRILIVAKKVLNAKQMTVSEKTNLMQLYNSYTELQGDDPLVKTYYDECMKLSAIPDEN